MKVQGADSSCGLISQEHLQQDNVRMTWSHISTTCPCHQPTNSQTPHVEWLESVYHYNHVTAQQDDQSSPNFSLFQPRPQCFPKSHPVILVLTE